MKHLTVYAFIIVLSASGSVFAEPVQVHLDKEQLSVNFNNLIDEGQSQKKVMTSDLSSRMAEKQSDAKAQVNNQDKQKVLDFIDIEVGFGSGGPDSIVDRRFDSVSTNFTAGPIDLKALVPNYLGTGS